MVVVAGPSPPTDMSKESKLVLITLPSGREQSCDLAGTESRNTIIARAEQRYVLPELVVLPMVVASLEDGRGSMNKLRLGPLSHVTASIIDY